MLLNKLLQEKIIIYLKWLMEGLTQKKVEKNKCKRSLIKIMCKSSIQVEGNHKNKNRNLKKQEERKFLFNLLRNLKVFLLKWLVLKLKLQIKEFLLFLNQIKRIKKIQHQSSKINQLKMVKSLKILQFQDPLKKKNKKKQVYQRKI